MAGTAVLVVLNNAKKVERDSARASLLNFGVAAGPLSLLDRLWSLVGRVDPIHSGKHEEL